MKKKLHLHKFQFLKSLTTNIQVVNKITKPHECEFCNRKFAYLPNELSHTKNVHKQKLHYFKRISKQKKNQ